MKDTERRTITLRFAADGSEDDIYERLLRFDKKGAGGMQGEAKRRIRQAYGMPEPSAQAGDPSAALVEIRQLRAEAARQHQELLAAIQRVSTAPPPQGSPSRSLDSSTVDEA